MTEGQSQQSELGADFFERRGKVLDEFEQVLLTSDQPVEYPTLSDFSSLGKQLVLAELIRLNTKHRPSDPSLIEHYRALHPELQNVIDDCLPDQDRVTRELPQRIDADLHPTVTQDTKRSNGMDSSLSDAPTIDRYEFEFDNKKQDSLRRMGDYEILSELGRGGMGVVFKARQLQANRVVALKVIRADRLIAFDEKEKRETIQRFQSEAQAAASFDHDNMVTVFEVGEIDGKHFYSMRFVPGKSLSEILTDGPLENVRAAKYSVGICRAIQAAHERKILHRDLKPSNVMVDEKTDRALVADFGLAKLLSLDRNETQTGTMIGTPAYMAPEQTRDASKVSEAADIYSIGATLYHLLVGRPPFQTPSIVETIRQVNSEDPVAPRRLNPSIHRDLETITLKCLEKDPRRRYQTAQEIEEELGRFLKGEPISSRPLGPARRSVRWMQRNPALAGLSAVCCLLFAGMLVSLVYGYVSTSNALAREQTARAELVEKNNEVRQQAARANENLNLAYLAADKAFTRVASDWGLRKYGLEELRVRLLETALPFLEQFADQEPDNVQYQMGRARALGQLAKAHFELGNSPEADRLHGEALQLIGRFRNEFTNKQVEGKEEVEIAWALTTLQHARVKLTLNRIDEGISQLEESLTLLDSLHERKLGGNVVTLARATANANLGTTLVGRRQQFAAGIKAFEKAIDIRKAFRTSQPDDLLNQVSLAESYMNCGSAYLARNDLKRAKESYDQGLEIIQADDDELKASPTYTPLSVGLHYQYAILNSRIGNLRVAESHIKQSIDDGSKIVAARPNAANFVMRLAKAQLVYAKIRLSLNRPSKDTKELIDTAASSLKKLAERTGLIDYLNEYASAVELLAVYYDRKNDYANQEQVSLECLRIRKQIFQDVAKNLAYKANLALAHYNLGVVYDHQDKDAEAEVEYLAARRHYQQLLQQTGDQGWYLVTYTDVLNNLVRLYVEQDRMNDARVAIQETVPILNGLPKTDLNAQLNLARVQLTLGDGFLERNNSDQANSFLSQAIKTMQSLLEKRDDENARILLAAALMSRAEVLGRLGEIEQGNSDWREALKWAPAVTGIEIRIKQTLWNSRYAKKNQEKKSEGSKGKKSKK